MNTAQLVRAAGTLAITYACDVMGMSDTHLLAARAAVARAAAPDSGGKSPDFVLYALDAAGGTTDPAFDAHVLPLKHWALAHWERWYPRQSLLTRCGSHAETTMCQTLGVGPRGRPGGGLDS